MSKLSRIRSSKLEEDEIMEKTCAWMLEREVVASPLFGPLFTNIFLAHHERSWLANCPPEFKPLYFRRYINDCFVIFRFLITFALFKITLILNIPNQF